MERSLARDADVVVGHAESGVDRSMQLLEWGVAALAALAAMMLAFIR